MDKIDVIGFGIIGLIAIIGLLTISYLAIKRDNYTIEQSDKLEKICLKTYKTDLKNDSEIKELKKIKITTLSRILKKSLRCNYFKNNVISFLNS